MAKIAVIGAGQVGATVAYTLACSGLAEDIAVVDINEALAAGVAADISHGMPFLAPVKVHAGNYDQAQGSDVVIMTAGAAQQPGQSRRELVGRNLKIMESAAAEIVRVAPGAILIVVSNPLDALTRAAIRATGFPEGRVFGSGTVLDTARLTAMLSAHTGVDARSIFAYVLGEHGDSEFAAWSLTRIAGMSTAAYCKLCEGCTELISTHLQETFDREVRNAAYAVIDQKGATCYAVAQALRRIVSAILRNEHSVLTVSTLPRGAYGITDVALSLPCVIGRNGIERILEVELTDDEHALLHKSAAAIRETLP